MVKGNLFENLPGELAQEQFQSLCQAGGVRVERILSRGQTTDWFDQAETEWVTLLAGEARILFEAGDELSLKPGDWLLIPAHKRHRVTYTSSEQTCVWLAMFWG
jgi:cupin 2 domain-containing protein